MLKNLIEIFLWRPWSFVTILLLRFYGHNLCLNIGCGPNVEAKPWINFDYKLNRRLPIYIDISRKLNFRDASVSILNAEHVVEHIEKAEQIQFLQECFRILRVGAIMRIVVPYADPFFEIFNKEQEKKYISIYSNFDPEIATYSDVCNNLFNNHGHRYIWFKHDLVNQLKEVGFTKVEISKDRSFGREHSIIFNKHNMTVGNDVDDVESLRLNITK